MEAGPTCLVEEKGEEDLRASGYPPLISDQWKELLRMAASLSQNQAVTLQRPKASSLGDPGFQFSSVSQLCLTLCNPMDCSSLRVLHQLLELAQIHVHRVGDAIQPSHPLSSLSPSTFNLSQQQGFSSDSVLCIRWPKYWSFSFSISLSNEYQDGFLL